MQLTLIFVILSIGTLIWISTKHKYISLLSIPPITYLLINSFPIPDRTLGIGFILILMLLQIAIIIFLQKYDNKNNNQN